METVEVGKFVHLPKGVSVGKVNSGLYAEPLEQGLVLALWALVVSPAVRQTHLVKENMH